MLYKEIRSARQLGSNYPGLEIDEWVGYKIRITHLENFLCQNTFTNSD